MSRLPQWIRIRLRTDGRYCAVQKALQKTRLNTVCESANCPNKAECFSRGTATVMIMGNICTRNCRFCAIQFGTPSSLANDEPDRVAQLAARLGLRHVVVTSVTRDDINDGGASMFARTITCLKALAGVSIEVLTPDFKGIDKSVSAVLAAQPDVFNHNLETVKRLQPVIRPQADYYRSLAVLRFAADWQSRIRVKSGLMVGLGETDEELLEAKEDLLRAGCEYLTIGQYLAPSRSHFPVARFVQPKMFEHYRQKALTMGFKAVASGPLVRSSYKAESMLSKNDKHS